MTYLLKNLAQELGQHLLREQWQCAVAESCTGGALAATITDCPGSSQWFDRGFVTYSNAAKQTMLGVPKELITQFGAVSREVVIAMAEGALKYSLADITIAISGVAGPSGGSSKTPVGTVWIALSQKIKPTQTQHYIFKGDRLAIREQSVEKSLSILIANML